MSKDKTIQTVLAEALNDLDLYAEKTFESLRKIFGDHAAALMTAVLCKQAAIAKTTGVIRNLDEDDRDRQGRKSMS